MVLVGSALGPDRRAALARGRAGVRGRAGWAMSACSSRRGWCLLALALAQAGMMSMMGPFWSLPTSFLSGTAAAGGIALINSVANLGGVLSPNVMGHDLSLLVAPEYPCTWPTWPRFQINHYADRPAQPLQQRHPDHRRQHRHAARRAAALRHRRPTPACPTPGRSARRSRDKIPAWQFGGEACVIDCRDLLDAAPPGHSPLIKKERVIAWEKKHRPLGPGDVVLFRSGYSDKYYRPLPEGRRFAADPVEGKAPAWPDPDPDCMEYLASRKVMTLGTDSTSMGPLPDLAEPTHFAGPQARHDLDRERDRPRGQLPPTGAFYCMLGPKHAGGALQRRPGLRRRRRPAGPTADRLGPQEERRRSVGRAVRGPARLVARARASATIASPTSKILFGLNPNTKTPFETHMLDSHTGTHLVPPAYALPPEGFDNSDVCAGGARLAGRVREEVRPARHERRDDGEGAAVADLRPGPGHRREAPRWARPTGRAGPPRRRSRRPTSSRYEERARRTEAGRHRDLPQRLERSVLPSRSPRARPAWTIR